MCSHRSFICNSRTHFRFCALQNNGRNQSSIVRTDGEFSLLSFVLDLYQNDILFSWNRNWPTGSLSIWRRRVEKSLTRTIIPGDRVVEAGKITACHCKQHLLLQPSTKCIIIKQRPRRRLSQSAHLKSSL